MAFQKHQGAPWLYDDTDGPRAGDIIGLKDPDGSEFYFARAGHYGAWRDLSDQTALLNTATVMEFDTEVIASGIEMVDSKKITFTRGGKFNFTLTAQIQNSDNQIHNFYLWGRLNGIDIPGTMTRASVPESHGGNAGSIVLERTYFAPINAGDYIEVMWLVDDVGITLQYSAAQSGPPVLPSSPSVALSVYEVAI